MKARKQVAISKVKTKNVYFKDLHYIPNGVKKQDPRSRIQFKTCEYDAYVCLFLFELFHALTVHEPTEN